MIQIQHEMESDLIVKVAETPDEYDGAFKVLHDAYVESGFCDPLPDGKRRIPHHDLEETAVIIAKMGNQVVGTLTLAGDEVLNLPIEKSWPLSELKKGDKKVVEVTCLAIDRRFRRSQQKNILFPLLRFMYAYSSQRLKVNYLVVATHPNVRDFYEGLLFFEPLDSRVIEDYIRAPAIGLYLDLKAAPKRFSEAYAHQSPERNLYQYFVDPENVNA